MYLGCWRAYVVPVVFSTMGMALRCLLPLQHYDVISLRRSFVTTELVQYLSRMDESARARSMLDTDGLM